MEPVEPVEWDRETGQKLDGLVSAVTSSLFSPGPMFVVHGDFPARPNAKETSNRHPMVLLFLLGIGTVEVRALGLARKELHAQQYDTSRMSPWVFGPYRASSVTV